MIENWVNTKLWEKEQEVLSKKLVLEDAINMDHIHLVAGIDLAYYKLNEIEYGVCCVVIYDMIKETIVEKQFFYDQIEVPYIPSFLSYREIPLILPTINKLQLIPDIFMCDGNGFLHPRNMGLASQLSFYVDQPTIGVSKTYYKMDGVDFKMPLNKSGAYTNIVVKEKICGRALRSHENVRPIFISIGNRISLDSATKISMKLVSKDSRLPIPVRMADLETHIQRKILLQVND